MPATMRWATTGMYSKRPGASRPSRPASTTSTFPWASWAKSSGVVLSVTFTATLQADAMR